MTLLDFPQKTACTIFTWGCNLRCPFCHNAGLVTGPYSEALTADKLYAFLEKRRGLLDGVCITGGEPLLQADLKEFLKPIREMGFAVKLDTNGTLPSALRDLCESGCIDMVAMDIKNCPEKYALTAGTERLRISDVQESIRFLMQGKLPYEFRTTVVREYHTADDLVSISRWIRGASHYYLQSFRDSGSLIGSGMSAYSPAELHAMLEAVRREVPHAELRGV